MRNMKKFLALVLAVMMVLSLMAAVSAVGPTDTSGNPYEDAIKALYSYGVVQGDASGSFLPDQYFTRAQMAGIAYKVATGDVKEETVQQNVIYAEQMFNDVTGHWAEGYIGFCANWGIVDGVGGERFNPDGVVSGYEIAGLMLKLLGYGANGEFSGSNWQKEIGRYASQTGISLWLGSTDLKDPATRAEVAQVVYDAAFNTDRVQHLGNGVYKSTGEKLINVTTESQGEDMWGAPSTTYRTSFTWPDFDKTDEKQVADEPLLEVWWPVSQAEVYNAAGLSSGNNTLTIYTNGTDSYNIQEDVPISPNKTAASGEDAMGGQGRWTRVYSDRIVYVDTFLGAVASVNEAVIVNGKVAVPASYSAAVYYNNFAPGTTPIATKGWGTTSCNGNIEILGSTPSFAAYDLLASYAIADYAAGLDFENDYPVNGVFTAPDQIQDELVSPYKIDTVRVTIKSIVKDIYGNEVGVEAGDGTEYLYNCTYAYNARPIGVKNEGGDPLDQPWGRLTNSDIGTTRTLYLDARGNILGVMGELSSAEIGDAEAPSMISTATAVAAAFW